MKDKVVMVLDDEPGVLKFCQAALESVEITVIPMEMPQAAIGALKHTNVDLLLVDIRMPKMDGFQVMAKARKIQPDIAILIMTGYGTMETAIKALRLGANGLLLKPFDSKQEFIQDVTRAIAEREVNQETARMRAIQPLIEISEKLFSETDPNRLISLILDLVIQLIRCENAGYYRREYRQREDDIITLAESRGRALPGEPVGLSGGPVARAEAWGTLVRVNQTSDDAPDLVEKIKEHGFGSVMCAPVLRHPDGNRVLMAARGLDDPVFTESDVELFSILVRQAGVALENARLYAELRESLIQVKEQQKALVQTEKMAVIGRLTASIAHEVNNPLQAVRNCLHLVNHQDLPIEKRENYLALAQDELTRLMETVKLMLDFYRPSSSQREPVQIGEIIQTVHALLAKQLQQAQIDVEFTFSEEIPELRLVKNQVQQVFFNLFLNSLEAMPDGGIIQVETIKKEGNAEIYVYDTGPGVTSEVQPKLFEPFETTKPQGTGLGLSISYSIIDAHGGSIEYVPDQKMGEFEHGACFKIRLPINERVS